MPAKNNKSQREISTTTKILVLLHEQKLDKLLEDSHQPQPALYERKNIGYIEQERRRKPGQSNCPKNTSSYRLKI